jgi:hypothetical protein
MSILDDENILIEKTRETMDPSVMLDAVLGDYKITGSLFTKSGENLLKILPCFHEYEWLRYGSRLAMCHIFSRRVVLAINFDKILQEYSSFKYEYENKVRVTIYSVYCTFNIHDFFKSFFKLSDNSMWECKYIEDDDLKRIIYKKIKYN